MLLDISKDVAKELKSLPHKHASQITQKIFSLQWDPKPSDYRHISSFPGYYRVDSGEYRIVYKIVNDLIQVVIIGKRNDGVVYRYFQKLT